MLRRRFITTSRNNSSTNNNPLRNSLEHNISFVRPSFMCGSAVVCSSSLRLAASSGLLSDYVDRRGRKWPWSAVKSSGELKPVNERKWYPLCVAVCVVACSGLFACCYTYASSAVDCGQASVQERLLEMDQGDAAHVKQVGKEIIEIDPHQPTARAKLARLALRDGDRTSFQEHTACALEKHPSAYTIQTVFCDFVLGARDRKQDSIDVNDILESLSVCVKHGCSSTLAKGVFETRGAEIPLKQLLNRATLLRDSVKQKAANVRQALTLTSHAADEEFLLLVCETMASFFNDQLIMKDTAQQFGKMDFFSSLFTKMEFVTMDHPLPGGQLTPGTVGDIIVTSIGRKNVKVDQIRHVLKFIPSNEDPDPALKEYARLLQIKSKGIPGCCCPTLTEDGQPFMLRDPNGVWGFPMERAEGESINEWLKHHEDPNERVDMLIRFHDIVLSLDKQKLSHSDLKSGNVFVSDDGHVTLIDFGLTRSITTPTAMPTSDFWMFWRLVRALRPTIVQSSKWGALLQRYEPDAKSVAVFDETFWVSDDEISDEAVWLERS